MTELKTRPNDKNVAEFLELIEPDNKKADAYSLVELFSKVTNKPAVMWGTSIIGFDSYQYTNTQGTSSWLLTGFSPRKANLTLYIMQGFSEYQNDLKMLGKIKTAKSCLYIKKLSDIDMKALEDFLVKVVRDMRAKYA